MTPALPWTVTAARAKSLAARYPGAAEFLNSYARILDPAPEYDHPILVPNAFIKRQRELAHGAPEPNSQNPHHCPTCGLPPVTAALRPEADGARRFLMCVRCEIEWPYQRLLCPNCQEQDFDKLPVYVAEEFPHLRVEGCDTCKHYLICADLVKEPEALPLVEDIAALSLHLWATAQGYTKIEPNLFGF